MIPTIGIMIGAYILMRCVVVLQKVMKPDTMERKVLEAVSVVFAIGAFAVAVWGIQALVHTSMTTTEERPSQSLPRFE